MHSNNLKGYTVSWTAYKPVTYMIMVQAENKGDAESLVFAGMKSANLDMSEEISKYAVVTEVGSNELIDLNTIEAIEDPDH